MASLVRNETGPEGSLYELVARGVKDKYFYHDDKEAIHPFDWRYNRWPGSLPEERWTVPTNPARFGQRCEFEFELPGDVLVEAALVIELPSWLPPEMVDPNPVSDTHAVGNADEVYGYVNGIGYFLFERIQIFQDKILLQEVSGDALYAAQLTRSSWNQGFLTQQLAGIHDGSKLSIQRNATPGRLEIRLPMIGCSSPGDKGLPLCGLRQQPFRLRLHLRPLDRLVESYLQTINPAPWTKTFQQTTEQLVNGVLTPVTITGLAVPFPEIKQPTLYLRTKQLYLLNEARAELEKETIEVPYIRYYENFFSVNNLDYAPLEKFNSGDLNRSAILVKFLDSQYTVEEIITFFRNTTVIAQNRLYDFTNSRAGSDGQFYNSIKLTIAGQLREGAWEPEVWQDVVPFFKEERDSSRTICIMNWALGWRVEDTPPAVREPTGGINFTTADRPMLSIDLRDIDINPVLGYKQADMRSVCVSWALYRIRNGRGGLEYAN